MKNLKKNKKLFSGKSKSELVVFGIAFVIFFLWAFSLLYPLTWLFINSLKHRLDYLRNVSEILALPNAKYGPWDFKNYVEAFEGIEHNNTTFLGMILNSLWYCGLSLGGNLLISCGTGYVLSKYKFKGRGFIYTTAIVCMTLPIFGTGGAQYTFYYNTGMYDTPLYVMWNMLSGFGMRFMMLYAFFKGVSWDYAEAVFIDGGNDFTVFFKIMLPIAAPMVLTLAITGFIQVWNGYEAVLLYLPSYPTLAVGIFKVQEQFESDKPVYFAALIISTIPVIGVFISFSDVIMNNLSIGGLKG